MVQKAQEGKGGTTEERDGEWAVLDHTRHCSHGGFGPEANVPFAPSFLLSVSPCLLFLF